MQRSLSANPPAGTTPNAASHIAKRAFDIAVGSLLCLMAIPVVVVCAAVLVLQHHSLDVFFTHTRVGFGGEPVRMPKLRTLRRDTHPYADKTVVELIPVSTFARVLRRSHLDELPQLFLVPLGRLSLVGPRPRMVDEAADDDNLRFGAVRTTVLQGCSGLWQIGTHTAGRVSDAPAYDYFYVAHHTVRMDAWVLWRTLVQLVGAKPVELDNVPRWTMRTAARRAEVIDLTEAATLDLTWDDEPALIAHAAEA